jgi:hypothetical protein
MGAMYSLPSARALARAPTRGLKDSLDLVLATDDLERIRIAHDVHAAHVSPSLATDGALTQLGISSILLVAWVAQLTANGTGVFDSTVYLTALQ